MALTPGTHLGPYEITAQIGVGGMGEVYRATDRNLKRSVAIKVLPASVAGDADRLARFQREAEVLAALNHPNIAAIYGLEKTPQFTALVMELVEGDDLSQRIARGAIPLDEALPIAKQIADALEAAHEQGIVHRDLKPANIKVRSDGTVKVLDFGLAKAMEPAAGSSPSASISPTVMSPAQMSGVGVILGTAAYMAPEQAKGRPVDRRADIWAFGVVLYEMLTGQRLFAAEDVPDTLAAVLTRNLGSLALPTATPPRVQRLLARCLDRDPRMRLRDIGEARIEIDRARMEIDEGPATVDASTSTERPIRRADPWLRAAPWAIAAVSIGVAAWLALRPAPEAPPHPAAHFPIVLPPDTVMSLVNLISGGLALSPDGTHAVFAARSGSGNPQLYVRAIDRLEASPLRGTDNASQPFFSPDGRWVGFLATDGKLKKVPLSGGTVLTICDAYGTRGATWLSDDSIVFAGNGTSTGVVRPKLLRVSASGGAPAELALPDGKTEQEFSWPDALPGGKAILFTIRGLGGGVDNARIGVIRLDTLERRVLIEGGTAPHYLPSGHLVYGRAGAVLAVPFDVGTLQVRGVATQVLDGVVTSAALGSTGLAVSRSGSALYMPGAEMLGSNALVWVDRKGGMQSIGAPSQNYEFPRLSPDGHRLAVGINSAVNGSRHADVWVYEFSRGAMSRLTFEREEAETAVWSPDGTRLTYSVSRPPGRALIWKPADGSGEDEVLVTTDQHLHLGAWSPNGDALVSAATGAGLDGGSLVLLQVKPKPALRSLLKTQSLFKGPAISPDGRWIAYSANDTNQFEVFVQAFPSLGVKYQVSTEGGSEPRWARNGRELFFRNGDKMMTVATQGKGDSLQIGPPTLLFSGRFAVQGNAQDAWYDVSADGRFLMLKPTEVQSTHSMVMIHDWAEELKRRAPRQ